MNSRIIKKTAKDTNTLMNKVTLVDFMIFKFIKDCINKGEHESIMLPYFGKFAVKPFRKKLLETNVETAKAHCSGVPKLYVPYKINKDFTKEEIIDLPEVPIEQHPKQD